MEQAWLIVNAFLHSESFVRMKEMLQASAMDSGIDMVLKTNADFLNADSLNNTPKTALFFDKDIRLAKRMEQTGMRLFNSAQAIAVCDDKTLTALQLDEVHLPQPQTILCPMSFPGVGYGNLDFLESIANQLSFPLVVKEGKGSFGRQVYLAENMEQLKTTVLQVGHKEILFQRFIRESAGQDLRLYVVGSQVIASIRRINLQGDFRANLENGGTACSYQPTQEETDLALKACAACGTDFAGVDLLLGREGPLICEVNSNAHFLGLMAVTGINPANAIMQLIKAAL